MVLPSFVSWKAERTAILLIVMTSSRAVLIGRFDFGEGVHSKRPHEEVS